MKFDKQKWERTDPGFPPEERTKMLHDLTSNYKLTGIKYSELISMLGEPDYIDSSALNLSYKIILHYDMIDPDYGEYLNFYYGKDSIVKFFEIHDWKK